MKRIACLAAAAALLSFVAPASFAADQPKRVCTLEMVVGSHMPKRICTTVADRDAARKASQDRASRDQQENMHRMDRLRDTSHLGGRN